MNNREIKFRAWLTEKKSMRNVFNITWMPDEDFMRVFTQDEPVNYRTSDKCILMQFTGLEDAQINGNDVFEGDIIENCDTKELQVVYWNEDEAAWFCRYVDDEKRIVSLADSIGNLNKVIGNIHENPELLNP